MPLSKPLTIVFLLFRHINLSYCFITKEPVRKLRQSLIPENLSYTHNEFSSSYSFDETLFRQARRRSSSNAKFMIEGNQVMVLQPGPYFVLVGIILGIASQYLINTMLRGDRGISAFLSDGNNFNNSRFKTIQSSVDTRKEDPLPWLKLPKLDFVEVAGQENDASFDTVKQQLDSLKLKLDSELASGQNVKASKTMKELDLLMKKHGFEFEAENDGMRGY